MTGLFVFMNRGNKNRFIEFKPHYAYKSYCRAKPELPKCNRSKLEKTADTRNKEKCRQEDCRHKYYQQSKVVFIAAGIIYSLSKRTIGKGQEHITKDKCCENNSACELDACTVVHKIIIQTQRAGSYYKSLQNADGDLFPGKEFAPAFPRLLLHDR